MRYGRYYENKPSRMSELISLLGPMVDDVKSIFFDLTAHELANLLEVYSAKYGKSAANYAKKAIGNWRDGSTTMSGKTAEKLLELVPAFIPLTKRHEMVTALCDKYQNKRNHIIDLDLLNPSKGIDAYHVAINSYKNVETLKHLPNKVTSTLKWLSNDDVTALRAILSEVDRVTANKVAEIAVKEFNHLKNLINNKDITNGSYQVVFPNGTLKINIKQPSLLRKIYHSLF